MTFDDILSSEQISAVDPEALRKVWQMWPDLTAQRAGGMSNEAVVAKIAPGVDYHTVILHCVVLADAVNRSRVKPDAIDFVEAAKAIPLPVRSEIGGVNRGVSPRPQGLG